MLAASTRLAGAVKEWAQEDALVPYEDNIDQQGVRLGAFAAAFLDGQILLIRREDTGQWSMPAGALDVGETWANCALRELEEETSVGGKVVDLLAIFDFRLLRHPPRPIVMATFLVEPDPDGEPRAMPETLGAGYFPIDELPDMSPRSTARIAIDLYEGRLPRPYIDLP
jgi:ADP-ribose pyrophosphatase YjhB (NUDIX family)